MDNPFRKALEVLDNGYKWIKGEYRIEESGWCLMGALCEGQELDYYHEQDLDAQWLNEARWTIKDILLEQYPERYDGCVEDFNDHDKTDWDDIERVLEKAAVIYDEKGGVYRRFPPMV